jgi:DNA-binding IclR family transcriptional regulator
MNDRALECLCLLSPTPAPLAMLASDLGLEPQREVRRLLADLSRRGIGIEVVRDADNRHAARVRPESWPRALRLALQYDGD